MKPLSETLTELGIAFTFPIEITDANGNLTYSEISAGHCEKWTRDANGNETTYETSNNYWYRYELDAKGNETYFENSDGDKRGTPRSSETCDGKVVEVDGIKYELKAL